MYGRCAFELENSDVSCEDPDKKNPRKNRHLGTIETCKPSRGPNDGSSILIRILFSNIMFHFFIIHYILIFKL